MPIITTEPDSKDLSPKTLSPEALKEKEETKTYVGTKIIKGRPMDYETYHRERGTWKEGQETMGNGFKVTYDDGYISWSPKDVFERCYREISDKEKSMMW